MKIDILQLIEGAQKAEGLTVIIDVFRAFSTACYIFANGAKEIIPVGDIQVAYLLKRENPDFILMGERHGQKQPGFDFGNSPSEIEHIDFTHKTIVHTTSAGTQGLTNARHADEIITGSFVNAQAIIDYIRHQNPQRVSLVAMGHEAFQASDEDVLCAQFIKHGIENSKMDFYKIVHHLKTYHSAQKFFDPTIEWAPQRDFDLCLNLNRFNFILKSIVSEKSLIHLKKHSLTTQSE